MLVALDDFKNDLADVHSEIQAIRVEVVFWSQSQPIAHRRIQTEAIWLQER